MKEKFLFHPNAGDIKIQISIGTPGVANTAIYKRGNGDVTEKIGESPLENANIKEISIGNPETFEGKTLAIQTIINFGTIDKKLWPQLLKTISSDYAVKDSTGNQKNYAHDADDIIVSNDGKTVFLIKIIFFQKKNI